MRMPIYSLKFWNYLVITNIPRHVFESEYRVGLKKAAKKWKCHYYILNYYDCNVRLSKVRENGYTESDLESN